MFSCIFVPVTDNPVVFTLMSVSVERSASPARSAASVTSSRIEAILQGTAQPENVDDVHMEDAALMEHAEPERAQDFENLEATESAIRPSQRRRVAVDVDEVVEEGADVGDEEGQQRGQQAVLSGRRRRRAVSPHAEDADNADADEPAAGAADLRKRRWIGTADVNSLWFSAVSKETAVDKVSFDLRLEHGQTRPLLQQHVVELVDSLRERPPLSPLKVTLWEHTGERKLFVIGGQHLCRALQLLREERVQEGLAVPHWMTCAG